MGLERELLDELNQTISWKPRTGRDFYNKPTYGAAVVLAAKIQDEIQQVLGPGGEEATSVATIFLDGNPGIHKDDQITLPDGTTPPIFVINTVNDAGAGAGPYYTKLYVGNAQAQAA